MTSESGKKDDLTVRGDESDARPATAATPKPASELDETAEARTEEEPEQSPLAKLVARFTKPAEPSRDVKSGERTRGLVILAGTTIACLFLFFGLFTTDGGAKRKERQTKPSLGRPETAAVNPETANRSPVPQLSVNQQPNEDSGELTEKDVLGTMRNRGTTVPTGSVPTAALPASPARQTPNPARALDTVNFNDPALAEAYRRQGLKPPLPRTEVTDWNMAIADYQAKQKPAAPPAPVASPSELLRKSSIVFVRTTIERGNSQGAPTPALERKPTGLLPPGTALVARLQHSVSSAAKAPVVAVIEYNYEEGGRLIVPAGAKAYGELSQATPQGWVSIKFHTLEFPDESHEKIDGSAVSMERGVLRGDVNGKGGAKKFLTRTLTGVGTIAAYAVGGRGINGGIDNSVLLRERLSSNIALAGEQELATLAYQQNVVVTMPANTRFLLVLHEAGVSRAVAAPEEAVKQPPSKSGSEILQQKSTRGGLSELELREMVQLRNEMREMNRLMQNSLPKPDQPPFDEK